MFTQCSCSAYRAPLDGFDMINIMLQGAFTGAKAAWLIARDMCRNASGTLVLIPTPTEENDFISDIFRAQYLNESGLDPKVGLVL